MGLHVKIDETAHISNRELFKGIEAMNPEDYYWIKDRFNLMKTLREQIWHFKTSALKLSKQDLEAFEIFDLLKDCNKVQSVLIKKLNTKK